MLTERRSNAFFVTAKPIDAAFESLLAHAAFSSGRQSADTLLLIQLLLLLKAPAADELADATTAGEANVAFRS